jgi:hypothetical protein
MEIQCFQTDVLKETLQETSIDSENIKLKSHFQEYNVHECIWTASDDRALD